MQSLLHIKKTKNDSIKLTLKLFWKTEQAFKDLRKRAWKIIKWSLDIKTDEKSNRLKNYTNSHVK